MSAGAAPRNLRWMRSFSLLGSDWPLELLSGCEGVGGGGSGGGIARSSGRSTSPGLLPPSASRRRLVSLSSAGGAMSAGLPEVRPVVP
eukprot:scaffold41194_cov63-Phaeocystis_antarctica.AAC.3